MKKSPLTGLLDKNTQKPRRPQVLLLDTENTPTLYYAWNIYDATALKIIKDWHLLSFAWKWLGEKTIRVKALPDYPLYKKDPENDRDLAKDLWELFNKADFIIAHNAQFDIKHANTRFLVHGLPPPHRPRMIDTLAGFRKNFDFVSNKLNDLSRQIDGDSKVRTGGADLWFDCMKGDMKAWRRMKQYNKKDIVLLENRYKDLRPWLQNHPNLATWTGDLRCPTCLSTHLQKRGTDIVGQTEYQYYGCYDCHARFRDTRGITLSTIKPY